MSSTHNKIIHTVLAHAKQMPLLAASLFYLFATVICRYLKSIVSYSCCNSSKIRKNDLLMHRRLVIKDGRVSRPVAKNIGFLRPMKS